MRPYDFGWALDQLRAGMRVGRAGWNGRDMWLCLRHGYPEGVPISDDTAKATGLPAGSVQVFRPYILMRDAQGSFVPWLASQTDVLAEDWELVQ